MKLKILYINVTDEINIYNSNNKWVYWEYNDEFWVKREFDSNNNRIYREDSNGFWVKSEFDSNNNEIYWEYNDGFWVKREYDSNNNEIYYEHSDGIIRGKRPNKNKIWKLINNFVSLYYNFK